MREASPRQTRGPQLVNGVIGAFPRAAGEISLNIHPVDLSFSDFKVYIYIYGALTGVATGHERAT